MREITDCHDCGAKPGKFHEPGCDTEQCALCGGQRISCHCVYDVNGINTATLEEDHPTIYNEGPTDEMRGVYDAAVEKVGGRLPWTGIWPGVVECQEFGWWTVGPPWVPCDKDTPGARENLNRLYEGDAEWSRELRRFVLA